MGGEVVGIEANVVLAHGTYSVAGKLARFFAFACRSGTLGPRQTSLAELIVPFLPLAWLRTEITRPAESTGANPSGAALLTPREQEILNWLHVDKRNVQDGTILAVAPR